MIHKENCSIETFYIFPRNDCGDPIFSEPKPVEVPRSISSILICVFVYFEVEH